MLGNKIMTDIFRECGRYLRSNIRLNGIDINRVTLLGVLLYKFCDCLNPDYSVSHYLKRIVLRKIRS